MKIFAITVILLWFALVEIRLSYLFGIIIEHIVEKEMEDEHDRASR